MDWTQVFVVVVTAGAALGTWGLNEQSKRRFEDYTRREARYVELVRSIRGFHAGVAQRLQAVGDLVLGIRKDLLRRAPLKETDLKSSEFEILSANRS